MTMRRAAVIVLPGSPGNVVAAGGHGARAGVDLAAAGGH